jgi:hypothetical protein
MLYAGGMGYAGGVRYAGGMGCKKSCMQEGWYRWARTTGMVYARWMV